MMRWLADLFIAYLIAPWVLGALAAVLVTWWIVRAARR